jgi:hypothetical protein
VVKPTSSVSTKRLAENASRKRATMLPCSAIVKNAASPAIRPAKLIGSASRRARIAGASPKRWANGS